MASVVHSLIRHAAHSSEMSGQALEEAQKGDPYATNSTSSPDRECRSVSQDGQGDDRGGPTHTRNHTYRLVFLIQSASPGITDDQRQIVTCRLSSRVEYTARRLQSEKTMNQPLYLNIVNSLWVQEIAGKPDTQKECHGVS